MTKVLDSQDLNLMLLDAISRLPNHLHYLDTAFELLLYTGCRAEELAEFTRWEIINKNTVCLKPQKKNNVRYFDKSIMPPMFEYYLTNPKEAAKDFQYRKLQYNMNLLIGNYQIKIGNKSSLVHLFRHNYAKQLQLQGLSDVDIMFRFGHKDVSSTAFYTNSIVISNNWIDNLFT